MAGRATEVVDAGGGLITAGFDDAHIHLVERRPRTGRVDLFPLESIDTILAAIAGHAAAHPDAPGCSATAGCTSRSRACRPRPSSTGRCRPARVDALL